MGTSGVGVWVTGPSSWDGVGVGVGVGEGAGGEGTGSEGASSIAGGGKVAVESGMGEDAGGEGGCSSVATATVAVGVGDGELHDISTRQKATRTTGMRDIMMASLNLFDSSVRIWPK